MLSRADDVVAFWDWWRKRRVFRPPFEQSVKTAGVYEDSAGRKEQRPSFSAVIFREGPFQVEHLIYPPNVSVPEHQHPSVDTLAVFLSGDVEFTIFGKPVHTHAESVETETGTPSSLGRLVPIPHTCTHGVNIGPRGGSFLSVQKWLGGEVGRVSDDWKFSGNALSQH